MQQNNNNPLEENDFPQAERDRVLQKFETLSNLYGESKAEEMLTARETLILINTMANRAIEDYDEKLVQTALFKIQLALGGKVPTSSQELVRVSGECLNQAEKGALIAYYAQKTRNPKGMPSFTEIKMRR